MTETEILAHSQKLTRSIFEGWSAPKRAQQMHDFLGDQAISHGRKRAALMAAFSHFTFPLQVGAFRSIVPDPFWEEECSFNWCPYANITPIWAAADEWEYTLRIQKGDYLDVVYLVSPADAMPPDLQPGKFTPLWNTEVLRFTLCAPYLCSEIHAPDGIWLCSAKWS